MASSGWIRVATGIRLVASAAAKQASQEAGSVATRTAQHGVELAANLRHVGALQQQQQPPQQQQQQPQQPVSSKPQPNGWHGDYDTNTAAAATAPDIGDIKSTPVEEESKPKQPAINPLFHAPKAESESGPPPSPPPAAEDLSQPEVKSEETNLHEESNTMAAAENTEAIAAPSAESVNEDDNKEEEMPHTDYQRLKEGQAVPSTRFGRAFGFASLGAGLAVGTFSSAFGRLTGGSSGGSQQPGNNSNMVMNDGNADRLAASLCRMRGAALKMGQMLSIQDESLLPPELTRALKQVRQGADAMPDYQLQQQLKAQLGSGDDWQERHGFVSFDKLPFAAASVGQCHRATIQVPQTNDDEDIGSDTNNAPKETQNVVVKVQYPGVGRSIESDLQNLAMLVKWTGMAPKGLFLDNVIRVGKEELQVECDYLQEMEHQQRMKELVEADPILVQNKFVVPEVFPHLTTQEIITTAFAPGGTIDKVSFLDQEERNRIARTILYLTIQELFVWRFMQTDPNWGNFLYDVGTQTTSLIDFGATREYSKEFVDGYLRIVWASSNQDEERLMAQSYKMKFLTGEENDIMLEAHKQSGYTVGEPFRNDEPFDFRGSQLSTRMGQHTSAFMKHRLTPPPSEVYTLHRKLAGAFMLCIKLGAVIRCRDLLEDVIAKHEFEDGQDPPPL